MKYEKLNNGSNNKKVFLYGFITCAILLIVFNFFMSYAKYKSIDSVKLASGTITYESADLNVIAMFKNDGEGTEDIPVNAIPEGNYELSNASYCIIGNDKGNKIQNVFEYKDKKVYIAIEQKGTKCYVYFEKQKPPAEQTLAALGLKTEEALEGGTSFTGTACGTSDCTDPHKVAGLYKGTDDDGDTYYYRGNVDNNWVHFAGMYWRIIRINGDGTIRLIYSGNGSAETSGTGTQISTSKFNTNYNDNKYVGYMYNGGASSKSTSYDDAHKMTNNPTESSILTTIKTWYNSNIGNNSNYTDKIDGNAGFCGDRSLAENAHGTSYPTSGQRGYGTNATVYGPLDRAWGNNNTSWAAEITPTFSCANQARDLYTTNDATRGNKVLPVPVGLITMDEVIFAGGYPGKTNNGVAAYYLYTNKYYWTMSPWSMASDDGANVFSVYDNGNIGIDGDVSNSYIGVRPVINLKANTTFAPEGKGTTSNPYVVVTK